MTTLSFAAARSLQLHAMGLAQPLNKPATKLTLLKSVEAMRLLQLDTISVVNRSHYLVTYARVGAYPLPWLDQLLSEKKLFEVWAHEACLSSNELFWLLRHHADDRQHWSKKRLAALLATDKAAMTQLLKLIERQGPVKSSDFERPERATTAPPENNPGWWNWKPHKRYLEAWFAAGELMVLRREGFQRVYDLAARVRPDLTDTAAIKAAQLRYPKQTLHEQMQAIAVKALGITTSRWINDFFRTTPYVRDQQLAPLIDRGELLRVTVEGSDVPWYVHRDHQRLLQLAVKGTLTKPNHCALLSPFDPLVWHRERASGLFNFDYRIECYTPAEKRRYGYFCLPILLNDLLIGRVDAKAHRSQALFEVKALHFEANVAVDEIVIQRLARTIFDFARWHECTDAVVTSVTKPGVITALRRALKRLANETPT
jgi:uncharacterized protein